MSVGCSRGFSCQWHSPRTCVPGSTSKSRGLARGNRGKLRRQNAAAIVIRSALRRALCGTKSFTDSIVCASPPTRNQWLARSRDRVCKNSHSGLTIRIQLNEPLEINHHLHMWRFERGEDVLEVHAPWVRNQISHFDSRSMQRRRNQLLGS